jgi:hypothetical protein
MNLLEMAAYIARTTYTNEFCSLCRRAITFDEAKSVVSVESGENNQARPAHRDCWLKLPRHQAPNLSADKITEALL